MSLKDVEESKIGRVRRVIEYLIIIIYSKFIEIIREKCEK